MADYKSMYSRLFNSMTKAINILQAAQLETEEMFISQEDANIIELDKPEEDD